MFSPSLVSVAAAFAVALSLTPAAAHASGNSRIGLRLPAEKTSYVDPVTGYPVTVLTTGPANDQRIYQTHPQWTRDDQYIIFRSNRGSAPAASGEPMRQQAFAVNEVTGEIIQLTDDPEILAGTLNIARLSDRLYYLKRRGETTQLVELDLAKLFADSEAGTSTSKTPADYERLVATLPEGTRESGGFALDADERHAYIGVRGGDVGKNLPAGTEILGPDPDSSRGLGAGPGGIRSVDLTTGAIEVVIDTPFQMGHVQTNYWVPGEIVYCHETGGDAPQRMWTVRADGSGNRPLFPEGPGDWVTHEAVITRDEVLFNLIGHQPRLRANPTGIALVNLRTNYVEILGQIDETGEGRRGPGGFWHCNGSPDGRWAAGDTFRGNIWLIDRLSGEKHLLTTDHKMQPDHAHPYFSRDSKRVLIQSGHFSAGANLDLMVVTIPAYLQNRR